MNPVMLLAIVPLGAGLILLVDSRSRAVRSIRPPPLDDHSWRHRPTRWCERGGHGRLYATRARKLADQQRGRDAPDPTLRTSRIVLAGTIFAALQWVSLIWSTIPHRTVIFSIQAVSFIAYPHVFGSLPRRISDIDRGLIILLLATAGLAVALLIGFASTPRPRRAGRTSRAE